MPFKSRHWGNISMYVLSFRLRHVAVACVLIYACLLSVALAETGSTETISSVKDGIGVTVHETGTNSATIELQTTSKNQQYNVERLNSPKRLVIDLPGAQAPKGKDTTALSTSLISGVRFGNHPDKGRVVIDLPESANIIDSIENKSGKIVVSLSDNAAGAITTEASTKKAQPNLPKIAESEFKPLDMNSAANAGDSVAELSSVQITKGKHKGNMIVARLSDLPEFDLKQTAPSEYVLTIKDSSLAPGAGETQVAKSGSGSIRSVRPVNQGRDLILRIFAQPESNLVAHAEGAAIYVSDDVNLDDSLLMRAQANPEKAEEAADAKEPAATSTGEGEVKTVSNDDLSALLGSDSQYSGRLISLDLQDTDIDNALRIIAEVSNLNIIASDDVTGKVTLRLIDVPWDQALDVILKTNGLDKVQEGNVVRIAPVERLRQEREALKQAQQAEEELEQLQVKYVRISYAKASAIKPILDSVVSERGSIAFDERTNQVIVKDIRKGVKNVVELIKKLDLRTPQVLLETQIVEASRGFARDLGAELGGSFIASPETGNATGWNFPNSIGIGGGLAAGGQISSFLPQNIGSAISMVFDSADGTRSLAARLTAYEQDGKVKVVSRPSVATTNNTQAAIEAVTVVRIKKPSGGTTVQTGAGSSSSDGSATEAIKVGIKLTVTPQASPDYYVLLDVAAESSTLTGDQVDGVPNTVERRANSSVLVSSGQTFAMGGIYKVTDTDTLTGIPFLKDIPVLGTFFRSSSVRGSDEELLFFITPRIVEGSFDDASMKLSS